MPTYPYIVTFYLYPRSVHVHVLTPTHPEPEEA